MMHSILSNYDRYVLVSRKLDQVQRGEVLKQTDFQGLKINIVGAEGLKPDDVSHVEITQDKSLGETRSKVGSDPIWNQAIIFEIKDVS